jgi:succinoglycan biosynthesis protein ExoA
VLVKRNSDMSMLNPKAQGPTQSGPGRSPEPRQSDIAGEPRSFASAKRKDTGEGPARQAATWAALETEQLIGAHAGPQNQRAAAPDAARRALIVIPTLNEARAVATVIARVLDDDDLVDPLVVIADGGSTDETREIVHEIAARDPRVRLMENPGRLQSAGLNLAAASVASDRPWLVRVDAHSDYPKNYVSTLISEARRTGASAVVVSMDTRGETGFQRAVAAAQNSHLGTGGSAHRLASEGQWVDHGHHALFDLAAFEAIGGYDESFSHNEDAELDLRLTGRGGRIWLTDKVRIGYYPRSAPGALWSQYFSYGKGRARTVLKHSTPLRMRQALPLAVAPAMLGAVFSPLFWPLVVPALVWSLIALGFGATLAVRRREAGVLLAGPAGMIMHLAWSAGFWNQLLCHVGERHVSDLLAIPPQAAS